MNDWEVAGFNPLNHPICIKRPARITMSKWLGHVPFAMLLIDILRPNLIVELGTYTGVSYCAFCQAVEELGLGSTRCFAVDTWKGDSQSGYYGDEVMAELKRYHDPRYSHFSQLVRATFDDASTQFHDGSIDLLHIDGMHSYEAVRHDFETWFPKLSHRGVVLFHDIAVEEPGFGVWRFWEQIRAKYPHFALDHDKGLGMLIVGDDARAPLEDFSTASPMRVKTLQRFFEQLGERWRQEYEVKLLQQQNDSLLEGVRWLKNEAEEYEQLKQSPLIRIYISIRREGFADTLVQACRRLIQ